MSHYDTFNDVLVNLFREIQDIEEKALTASEFKDISGNDMHILEAIGNQEPRNMSSVAASLNVTVGTLTIAVNNLVKKGYVTRQRSDTDRRVVLLSLSEKGLAAFLHHQRFHEEMVQALVADMDPEEIQALERALRKLRCFFRNR
ncbi:MAG: MarR family winged helix-turn-helix transcriptional regulator [Blautia sp.]|jgi:DNA-binding MarR family transcriptional regulator